MIGRLITVQSKISYKLLNALYKPIYYIEQLGTPSRHTNPFATHVPVLVGLSQVLLVKKVLEFGSGTFSTFCFLNRAIFSSVETVISYENDLDWYESIRSGVSDTRLDLRFTSGRICEVLSSVALEEFDLIFVDDSKSSNERTQTIRQIASRKDEIKAIVVIHDFEQKSYRLAASPFPYQKRIRAFNPEVGLVWTNPDVSSKQLDQINLIIKSNSKHLEPDALDKWFNVLSSQLS